MPICVTSTDSFWQGLLLPYTAMVDYSNILIHFGGVDRNSLIRILNPNDEDQGIFYDEPSIIKNFTMMKNESVNLIQKQTILISVA